MFFYAFFLTAFHGQDNLSLSYNLFYYFIVSFEIENVQGKQRDRGMFIFKTTRISFLARGLFEKTGKFPHVKNLQQGCNLSRNQLFL